MRTVGVLVFALSFLLIGCDNGKVAELESKNKDLANEIASKDKYIEDVTTTMSEISNQLDAAWAAEKKVVRQTTAHEGSKVLTQTELRRQILSRISDINAMLASNRKRVVDLQHSLKAATTKYTGIESMVDDLKKTLEEREKSVAELTERVQNLQSEVTEKTLVIAARDETIKDQKKMIDDETTALQTVYYVAGSRSELKDKGIITREGGFLWGLFGSTTLLGDSYDAEYFQPIDKTKESEIEIPGKIDEIVPKRSEGCYTKEELDNGHTVLKITKPENFWRENHLVIITG
ncbi:MAG TPA: hypothetical protein VI758_02130 [Bacteroidota bacterium]